jgi:hypothetical protein
MFRAEVRRVFVRLVILTSLVACLGFASSTSPAGAGTAGAASWCDGPLPCPTGMHWDWWVCGCVCDCPNCQCW